MLSANGTENLQGLTMDTGDINMACPNKIGACHRFAESVVKKSSRSACSEKKSAAQGKFAAPREKILATLREHSKRHFQRQIQKRESDHQSQNKSVDIKSRDF